MEQCVAFVYPGQGSQTVGMLAELNQRFALVKETFDEASEVFGRDLWSLVQTGTKAELAQTEITQPIMFVAGVAVWRAWQSVSNLQPRLMAGHSLGEFTAYTCAGSISLAQGVTLVKRRSELMRDACPSGHGKMAAILGLCDEKVLEICQQAQQDQVVQAVNFNAPGQVVIAGHSEAVDKACTFAKQERGKAMILPVSVPCHSDLMRPASDQLAEQVFNTLVKPPCIPVINNLDANSESEPVVIREKLIHQLYSPVQWVATIKTMMAQDINLILECGPGKVLSGMIKRINPNLPTISLQDSAGLDQALELLSK